MHILYLVGKLKGGEQTFPMEAEMLYEKENKDINNITMALIHKNYIIV